MTAVGFDFGNLNCYIAVARKGGIEVITNDYSLHATPTCVAFGSKSRVAGVAARQQVNTNFKSTVLNFKQLIGRKFSDPIVQRMIPFIPCKVVELENDTIGMEVNYRGETNIVAPEQVLAALLAKLKTTTEHTCPEIKNVNEVVVTCPFYFDDVQRQAMEAAVALTGMKCIKLINEHAAVGISYGIYKQDLPADDAPPRLVAFIDCGHTSVQATLCSFTKSKCEVLGSTYDLETGGLYFDNVIRETFRQDFIKRFKIDAMTNPRAWLRLLDESEKVKKQMSANNTAIPLNIECFMNDVDVSTKMQRQEFEAIAKPLFDRIHNLLVELFAKTGKTVDEVQEVEIIGGSSRIPLFKQLITEFFNKEPKTTMNQDEAVARGAGMQSAILSPTMRVREFILKDCQPLSIGILYGSEASEGKILWKANDELPGAKLITTMKNQDFSVELFYVDQNNQRSADIGKWQIGGVAKLSKGVDKKIKIKVRLNANGIAYVADASLYSEVETAEVVEGEVKDKEKAEDDKKVEEGDKDKKKVVQIALRVGKIHGNYNFKAEEAHKFELQMKLHESSEKEKADAKNAVEEYVYEMRDKLTEQYNAYIKESDAEYLKSQLEVTENWLYDEGEDAKTEVYQERLHSLKQMGDPVVERYIDCDKRTQAFNELNTRFGRAIKFIDHCQKKVEAYDHIDPEDVLKVEKILKECQQWANEACSKQAAKAKYDAPHVWSSQVYEKISAFHNLVHPIMTKPKPKVEPPKEETPKNEDGAGQQDPNATSSEVPEPKPAEMEID